jgi:hypothetical protein
MKFQKTRDPRNVEIGQRAAALAAAGYPLPAHDSAMDAEAIIASAKQARASEKAAQEPVAE